MKTVTTNDPERKSKEPSPEEWEHWLDEQDRLEREYDRAEREAIENE